MATKKTVKTSETKTKTRRTYKSKEPLNENQVLKKKKAEKRQEMVAQEEARALINDLYQANLPQFIEKRKEEFEKVVKLYESENEERIAMRDNKLSQDDLEYLISKPLITISGAERKYSPTDLLMFNECFWDCVRRANKVMGNTPYIPTLQQLSKLMGVPESYFTRLYNSNDIEVANVTEMIKDSFINYYTVNGMTNRINSIMAIFILKAGYNMRDNEPPRTVINNITTTVAHDEIEKLEAQYSNFGNNVIDINEV